MYIIFPSLQTRDFAGREGGGSGGEGSAVYSLFCEPRGTRLHVSRDSPADSTPPLIFQKESTRGQVHT